MRSCGLIVEYNPFHNGHKYHGAKARQVTQAEVLIAVMSGNFLQRGEPAIIDKWHRTREALENGVDLVIELPFAYAVQSADYFAEGGVKLLQSMGCENLCFGTDSEEIFDYQEFGHFAQDNQALIDEKFQSLKSSSLNYPQKMTAVFRELYPNAQLNFDSPNHVLGMSYAKENAKYATPMKLFPIPRQKAGYNDTKIHDQQIASATAIRQLLAEGKSPAAFVPERTTGDLQAAFLMDWEKLWPFLRYKILSSSIEELQGIYQMSEGLEYRIKQMVNFSVNFSDFIEKLKSKRYTWVRLQRLMAYLLGNVTVAEVQHAQQIPDLRVLGFTEKGQAFMKSKKNLPWISRFGKEEGEQHSLTLKMDNIYQMVDAEIPEQNFGQQPIH